MFNQLLLGNKLTSLENMRSYFLTSTLITQSITQFHNLFLKRCSKACICGNKPNPTKNMSSYFLRLYSHFYVKIGNPSYMKKCQYILMLILKHLFPC
ncbi:hypothetical protein EFM1CSP_18465 [Enterococcus faecium]|nr:hypothetical protein EFM1CSP_18465 [Enterococcus faecium]